MASQPSVHNEERNRLRLRAWEQRNQEASQAKELSAENVPLFGEPYKTTKGDELSSRIQRMLGNYEDVNNHNPTTTELLPAPTYATLSQPGQGQPNTDWSTTPPFHDQVHCASTQSQTVPSSNGFPSQPMRTSAAAASPNHHGQSSALPPKASSSHSQTRQLSRSAQQQKQADGLPQEASARSPDAKPLPFLHSSDRDDTQPKDAKDAFDWHQLQESTDHPSAAAAATDVSTFNPKQLAKDAALPQASKGSALPSQTFPPLLSSKQPSSVMTQKPTAYVRPMDGQDQVASESPELKPSPEPYVSPQDKSDHGKTKMLPQFLETRANETLRVEDILREMTHSWPPLLTAIHMPSTDEPSKSPAPSKEAEHVSSCPGKKKYDFSPPDPSHLNAQSSSTSLEVANSSGVESASSSDSDSSSRSESESESAPEEAPQAPASSSKSEPDAPAVAHGDWQLGNWIRSNQQSSSAENQGGAHVSERPPDKDPQPTQSAKIPSVEVKNPTGESKPQLSSHQKEFSGNPPKSQQYGESSHNYCQQSSQESPSADPSSCTSSRKFSGNKHASKPAKAACSDHSEATVSVKTEEVVTTRGKDPCFTDRPKVKTKTGHNKKSKVSSDTKKDSKRTFKHTSLDKRKVESDLGHEVPSVLNAGHCPTCGVRHPNPCSCHRPGPAKSAAPPVRISCSKPKSETACQRGARMPHKTLGPASQKHSEKTGHVAKGSRDLHRPPRSLMVKIDLSLLSRVPQASGIHQAIPHNAKTSTLVIERERRGGDASAAHKHTKTSKKSISQIVRNAKADADDKTLPRKKRRLDKKNTSTANASVKLEGPIRPPEERERKKARKTSAHLQQPATPKDPSKDSKTHKRVSGEPCESSRDAVKSKESCKHKRRNGKHSERPRAGKQKPTPASQPTREASRPLLRFDDRQYPVKHYIKEAKRLKHKADAESDKLSKAFNYLDAAMYFVESGIAMEKDPQISMSSYTMFAETVELLKFVLKLKNSMDPSAPPSEKDFLALCLRCQSLLQMAMFHHKHKTALKYSKTLTDHFNNSAQATQDPSVCMSKGSGTLSPTPDVPSPAGASASSTGLPAACSAGGAVAVPQAIEQVAFTYVNITTLFLSAHEVWEQAEELAHSGSGVLTELDAAMGPLSLTSGVSAMVRYTRQGVLWLRQDAKR